jgi:DNA-binding response OmpR family regulator
VGRKVKVLTWEENRWIRRLIRANLEADGFQVCEAESEVECVEVAESEDCQLLL